MGGEELDRWISLSAGGDIDALKRLYEALRSPVFLLAKTLLGDAALAEDILQETFIRVYEHARTYRPGTHPKAWVMRIARNLAISALRKRRWEKPAEEAVIDAAACVPPDALALDEALGTLGRMERQIVVLGVVADLTHREIAQVLSIPYGSVSFRHKKAMEKLRVYYTSCEKEDPRNAR